MSRPLTAPSSEVRGAPRARVYVWQWPIRVYHTCTALAVTALFATGLYIAYPLFGNAGETDGGSWMSRARQVHFVAAFVFSIGFLWRAYWFWAGNEYARSGFPYVWRRAWWRALFGQAWDYLRADFSHVHLGHNPLAGLSYVVFVVGLGGVMMLTGFALYGESNPGGFWDTLVGWVIPLLGGSFQTHMWHHLGAWGFAVFVIAHIYIVVLDAWQQRNGLVSSMITGFKSRTPGDDGGDEA